MKTSSCKAKGRRCSAEVKDLLIKNAMGCLLDNDIIVTPSGVPGADLTLSPAANRLYPFAIECKNVERLNIWSAIAQSMMHAKKLAQIPVVFFKKNHSELYVTLKAQDFIDLIK